MHKKEHKLYTNHLQYCIKKKRKKNNLEKLSKIKLVFFFFFLINYYYSSLCRAHDMYYNLRHN